MSRALVRVHIVLVAVLLAAGQLVSAQSTSTPPGRETTAASVARYALAQDMPIDPEATVGTLPNGLRYYVRGNAKPAHRAELRLVVKAGSVLEDDDQRGLAHFVEHMQFEGTEHFPRQSVVEFLSSLGLALGPDANAATSYDDTQYTLRVPTDVPGALDRALLIMEDWTHAATFDQSGIERERPIVLSEWRMNLGAGERTGDKIRRVQLQGSRYADRAPIGVPESIERAQREQLLRFYRDWYRPDLMAVIAVGDFDRQQVEAMIKQHFSSIPAPAAKRPRPAFDLPEHAGTRYAVLSDRETTSTVVELTDLRPSRSQSSVGGYRAIMLDQLFSAMLGSRLDEIGQAADAPFVRAGADRTLFPLSRTRDEAVLQALVPDGGVPRGLEALLTELERVARFGFTASELDRERQAMMNAYERSAAESPDRESASRADEYTRNFLQGEALPTIWQELAFHRRFLPGVTLAEMNALAKDWFPDVNRLVLVSAPEVTGGALPSEAQLVAVAEAAARKKLEPYADATPSDPLIAKPPSRGSIVTTASRPESGITEWTLSNGARVVLKPTTLKEDQILFRAFAPGGTSLASDAEFMSARVADMVVSQGGVGSFSASALDRMLRGKAVGVAPFIDEIDHGLRGGSTPTDLETLFQLIYLRFTQPRADAAAFAASQAQARALLANQMASPDVVFNRTIDSALTGDSPRRQPETPATVDQWSLDRAMAFYRARFADAGNFTFVFVGSFTVEAMRPFVETYLASLPATGSHETWRDLGIRPPTAVIEKTVEKGIAPKSQVAIVFSGPFQDDEPHRLALRAVALVVQSRLNDAIRQELGGTYSITADENTWKLPRPEYSLRIEWTCDPARTADLVRRVFQEIDATRSMSFNRTQVGLIRDAILHSDEQNMEQNGYLLSVIARRYEDGDVSDLASLTDMKGRLAALTAAAIHEAADAYLDTSRYVKVTLVPGGK